MLPAWASECISHAVAAYLAAGGFTGDPDLIRVAGLLKALPVYGDLGGVLLVCADGEVYCRCNDTMELRREPDPRWRMLAWVAAAEAAPELRRLLPTRPVEVADCLSCGGTGRVQVTPKTRLWCGGCWGLGWRQESTTEPVSLRDRTRD